MYHLLVGSYTHRDKKGIYVYDFEESTGLAGLVAGYDEVVNPSYLIVEPMMKSLYVVSETNGADGGGVARYSIQEEGYLHYEGMEMTHGKDPCHLTRHQGKLVVGNYSSGNFSVHDLSQVGEISPAVQVVQHQGKGANPERQEGPHVHFVQPVPGWDGIAVVDLGLDRVMFYEKRAEGYVLYSRLQCKVGVGPRHLVFHPTLPRIYVVGELNSTVNVYENSGDYSEFHLLQEITTLPDGFKENNQCAAIVISRDGRYLYVTNRGHNSIATYLVDSESGSLALSDVVSTEGNWPRDCALSPTEHYFFVANEHSDVVSVFERDLESGHLQYHSTIPVSEPTCIKFIV